MPLDIKVEGDPESIRQAAQWLRGMSESVHDCGTQVGRARTESEADWSGDAGAGFRRVTGEVGSAVDTLSTDFGGTCDALTVHADDLDTVKTRMGDAVSIAQEAGLGVTENAILEPGPAPPDPAPLPADAPPTPAQADAHAAATTAQAAYATKVRAYQNAGQVVTAGRRVETDSQSTLNSFLGGFVEKLPFTVADFSSGLAGAAATRTSKFRAAAQVMDAKAARAAKLMHSPNLNLSNQTRAALLHAQNTVNANAARNAATASRFSRMVDRLPQGVKNFVTRNLDRGLTRSTPILGKALPVLKRVPVAGALITAGGIGFDIASGKDPVQSTVSGVSSLAAGAAVGAMIGGPVGVVVGGVVGVGVGFVVDEWGDEIASGVGDAAEGVKDFVGGIF